MSEMTYGQKKDALQGALKVMLAGDASDGDYCWCYVDDWTDSWVVYDSDDGQFQINYSMDESGAVTFSGEPVPVFEITTYAPVVESELGAHGPREHRGMFDARSIRMALDARGNGSAPAVIKSEPLTYHEHAPHSFYRDLILTDRVQGAGERLARHRQEMDVLAKEREARAWQNLREARVDGKGFEYRVTPNSSTAGQGAYLAPPEWLNELFAPAKRPGRVLANRIALTFDLPSGTSNINVPILTTGTSTAVQPAQNSGVTDTDILDAAGSSLVVAIVGNADIPLQMLEQSPVGATVDALLFKDMTADYDSQLEGQMLYGAGSASNQILGLWNVTNIGSITYTDASPTGKALYPYLGQMAAKIGNQRSATPEIWMMRTARWAWLTFSEDSSLRPLEFPTLNGEDNPMCPGAPGGWPAWLNDQIPATITTAGVITGGANDSIIACKPSDLVFLEGQMQTSVMRDPLSGTLGVRLQLHNSIAFISNRYPSGTCRITGTGMATVSGWN